MGQLGRDLGAAALAADAMVEHDVAVFMVPSVIVLGEQCCAINPEHAQFANIQFEPAVPFEYDPRLLRERRGN